MRQKADYKLHPIKHKSGNTVYYLYTYTDGKRRGRSTGEAFTRHQVKLTAFDFQPEGNMTKLLYLDQALEGHRESKVYANLKEMSVRQFREYAIPQAESKRVDYTEPLEITDSDVNALVKRVGEIRARNNFEYVCELQDQGEKRVVDRALKEHRERS